MDVRRFASLSRGCGRPMAGGGAISDGGGEGIDLAEAIALNSQAMAMGG